MGGTASRANSLKKGGVHEDKSDLTVAVARHHQGTTKRCRQHKNAKDKIHLVCKQTSDEKQRVKVANKGLADGVALEVPVPKCEAVLVARRREPAENCIDVIGEGDFDAEAAGIESKTHWEVVRRADHTCVGAPKEGKGARKAAFSSKMGVRQRWFSGGVGGARAVGYACGDACRRRSVRRSV